MDRKYRHAERNNTGGIAFRIFISINGSGFSREEDYLWRANKMINTKIAKGIIAIIT